MSFNCIFRFFSSLCSFMMTFQGCPTCITSRMCSSFGWNSNFPLKLPVAEIHWMPPSSHTANEQQQEWKWIKSCLQLRIFISRLFVLMFLCCNLQFLLPLIAQQKRPNTPDWMHPKARRNTLKYLHFITSSSIFISLGSSQLVNFIALNIKKSFFSCVVIRARIWRWKHWINLGELLLACCSSEKENLIFIKNSTISLVDYEKRKLGWANCKVTRRKKQTVYTS